MSGAPATPGAGRSTERLDERRVLAGMGAAQDGLAALEIVDVTGSTSQDLLRRPADAIHRVARLAERQTAGRGRRGRSWFSPHARNVYLSLGWRFRTAPASLGHLPLVVAVAVARAVTATGFRDHGIKWPNDIVTARGKLAGCLVESRTGARGARTAVLGVGVNVRLAGADGLEAVDQPWDDLASQRSDVSRDGVAAALLTELVEAMTQFEASGFAPFQPDWQRYDRLAGRDVSVLGEAGVSTGLCVGLGPRGGLLVETGAGERAEHLAGEVSVRATL